MFTALLDTCVLVPNAQRDVLFECASAGIYRPVWSQAILDELAHTLTRLLMLKGRTTDEVDAYVTRLRNQMHHAFPDALTTGWDHRVGPPACHPASRPSTPTTSCSTPSTWHPTTVLAAIHAVAARTGRHGPAR